MTVKVCLFPEGEDPDSFAKSTSTEELKKYLDENQKDFVGFKTDVLLKGTENDPIQRAGLIKEIIGSIALLPDSITRSVYLKQTASQFEITEQTLLNELNTVRRKKQNDTRGIPTPNVEEPIDLSPKPSPNQSGETLKRDFYYQELDLIRILVLYGSRAIEIEVENPDENNNEDSVDESAAELIISQLERDDLGFNNPLFQKIYELCQQGLKDDVFYEAARFLRNEDPEIVKFVTDVLSPRHELSRQWLNTYKIETTEEIHLLAQAVVQSLYTLKYSVIMRRIQDIQEELKGIGNDDSEKLTTLIKEQMSLEKIKVIFALKLDRKII
jgi:DNA primase